MWISFFWIPEYVQERLDIAYGEAHYIRSQMPVCGEKRLPGFPASCR